MKRKYNARLHYLALAVAVIGLPVILSSEIGIPYGIPAGLVSAFLFYITMRP